MVKKTRSITSLVVLVAFLVAIVSFGTLIPNHVIGLPEFTEARSGDNAKLSSLLSEEMDKAADDEKLLVWIWFGDIDQEQVDRQVERETGLTADNLSVEYEAVPEDLLEALEWASEIAPMNFDINNEEVAATVRKLKNYIDATEPQRFQERKRTDTYVGTRRHLARQAYIEKNSATIADLNLPESEIVFQSELTPSSIVRLTKAEILGLVESNEVVAIDFYDDTEHKPPYNEQQRTAMRVDLIRSTAGLTGSGINVMMHDHGWVRSDVAQFNLIAKPGNIQNVRNRTLYAIWKWRRLTT
jgi:hypothetical protein